MEKICIIGLGKLGSHLYYSLNKTGKFRAAYIVRSPKTKIIPAKLNSCGIIFISTQDSSIRKVVKELLRKKYNLKDKYIYHTSGALSSDVLHLLKKRGVFIGSFHPIQTFESRVTGHNRKFRNIYLAVEGDTKAVTKAREIAKSLGSKAVVLNANDKVLHHINSVIASNYLTAFFNIIEEITDDLSVTYTNKKIPKNGFKKSSFFNIYKPLIEQTIRNIESKGIAKSLTGPVERNDLVTVKLQLDTLKNRLPALLPFYSLMGIETAKIALNKKSITAKQAQKMVRLFKKNLSFSKIRIKN